MSAVAVDDAVRYFAPHVLAAGLVVWAWDGVHLLTVGTRPDSAGHYVTTPVDAAWAYGDEAYSFELIADRLARQARA